MIIISGCSWACGEWARGDTVAENEDPISHKGLEQYLVDAGYTVLNLSQGALSNLQIANRIFTWIDRHPNETISKIFVFQTEYLRDYWMSFQEDFLSLTHADSLSGKSISRFYYKLSTISKIAKCPVYLIGELSDTLWIGNMETCYPGVKVVCQSMTNLIVNNNHRVAEPVLDWYLGDTAEAIEKIKKSIPDDEVTKLLKKINDGFERENIVFSNSKYFWPDGRHPNRYGHQILFDFLKHQNLI
jgi:hypothetical protein